MSKKQNTTTYAHNLVAAQEMINFIQGKKGWALANRCTGSGKTFIMKEVIKQLSLKDVIIIGPSHAVIKEVEKTLKTLPSAKITYMTYQRLCRAKTMPSGFDSIIFDEAHHMEAPVWKAACFNLAASNSNAIVMGFTGTVKRGDGIDISKTIFPGIATILTYDDAFQQNILLRPTIVSTYFKVPSGYVAKTIQNGLKKVGIDNPKFIEAKIAAEKLELDWSRIKIEEHKIIGRHLPKNVKKVVVFFDNISDLHNYKVEVESWFRNAGFNPQMIEIYSKQTNTIKATCWGQINTPAKAGRVKVILSVDMLREGIHVSDVEAVIFLRRTNSSTVFLQQVGRCLRHGQTRNPVIFDFVGNIQAQTLSSAVRQLGISGKSNGTGAKNSSPTGTTQQTSRFATDLEIYEYNTNQAVLFNDFLTICNGLAYPDLTLEKIKNLLKVGDIETYANSPELRRYVENHRGAYNNGAKIYPECIEMHKRYKDWKNDPKNYVRPNLWIGYITGDFSNVTKEDEAWLRRHNGSDSRHYHYPIVDKITVKHQEWKKQNCKKT